MSPIEGEELNLPDNNNAEVQAEATQPASSQAEQPPALDGPFAAFGDLRAKLTTAVGEDTMKALDVKVSNRETLSDDELALIANQSGKYTPDEVKAFLGLFYEKQTVAEKAAKIDQQEADAYLAEINEIAGGDYKTLLNDISKIAPQSKIAIWNVALKDVTLQKDVLKEMADFRKANQTAEPVANKSADLSLLTKANNAPTQVLKPSSTEAEQTAQVNPLEGNPLAYLAKEPAGINRLCAIKLDATNPQRANAIEVLKVIAPELL